MHTALPFSLGLAAGATALAAQTAGSCAVAGADGLASLVLTAASLAASVVVVRARTRMPRLATATARL